MRLEQNREGWCFNREGKLVGPVSVERLKGLLAAGEVEPGQPVWSQDGPDRTFLRAEQLTRDGEAAARRTDTPHAEPGENNMTKERTENEEARTVEHYRQLAERLQAKCERQDRFLAVVSHELRHPLAPILTTLEVLRQTSDDPAGHKQSRLLLERQVKKLVRLMGVETARPSIDGHNHQFHLALPEEPVWLEADPTRLEQVVVNLLANAAKYTPEGGTITLSLRYEDGRAVLGVRDTGIGIAPEMLSRIFELFMQAEPGRDHAEGGLGVGLTLVKALVEMHEGAVEAYSAGLDQGSEFLVRLPVSSMSADREMAALRPSGVTALAIPGSPGRAS
jgi:signal transduction histidine kinase